MTLDIVSNGTVATGDVYAQPQRTGVLWDAYLVKPLFECLSEYVLHFLACVVQRCVKQYFSWNDKCTWDKVKTKTVMLLITFLYRFQTHANAPPSIFLRYGSAP